MNSTPLSPSRHAPHAVALIVATLASLLVMVQHPTAIDPLASVDAFKHEIHMLIATHVLALVTLPVMLFGFLGICQRLGFSRPSVQLGMVFYALSIVAIMLAAVTDGLVGPALLDQALTARETLGKVFERSAEMNLNFQLNQACAKVYVVGTALAFGAWSLALWRDGKQGIAAWGWLICGLCVVGLLSGHVRMNAHGFGLIVLCQATWTIALAVLILREKAPG